MADKKNIPFKTFAEVYIKHFGNKTLVAQELGITVSTVNQRINRQSKQAMKTKRAVSQKIMDVFNRALVVGVGKGNVPAMKLFAKLHLGLDRDPKDFDKRTEKSVAKLSLNEGIDDTEDIKKTGIKIHRIPVYPGHIPELPPQKEGEVYCMIPAALVGLWTPKRFFIADSGRGAGKSYAFATEVICRCFEEKQLIYCLREVKLSTRDSIHRLLAKRIEELGVTQYFKVMRDEIRCTLTGAEIKFNGLLDMRAADSIKSLEGAKIAWVEEGQSISALAWDILTPTIRKDYSEIWVSMNRRRKTDVIYEQFLSEDAVIDPGTIISLVNWRDNPWFNDILRAEKDRCQKMSDARFQHVWEGELQGKVGRMIKRDWWQRWTDDPNTKYRFKFLSADTAYTEEETDPTTNEKNSYSVIQVWGLGKTVKTDKDGKQQVVRVLDLLDSDRGRWNYPDLLKHFKDMLRRHKQKDTPFPIPVGPALIEKKASGQSLIQSLRHENIRVKAFEPGSDSKEDRVYACENVIFGGQVRIPANDYAPWVKDFLDEISDFSDNEDHEFDDQVDAMSQAIIVWKKQKY